MNDEVFRMSGQDFEGADVGSLQWLPRGIDPKEDVGAISERFIDMDGTGLIA